MEIRNKLDINHVFTISQNGGTLYLPFRSISFIYDKVKHIEVTTKTGAKILINDSEVCDEFMAEYRGCVGLGE